MAMLEEYIAEQVQELPRIRRRQRRPQVDRPPAEWLEIWLAQEARQDEWRARRLDLYAGNACPERTFADLAAVILRWAQSCGDL